MIRLSLRLTLKGGRDAVARLVMTTIAVAVGAAMLLMTLAAVNGVNSQNARYAWLETPFIAHLRSSASTDGPSVAAPALWRVSADYFQGDVISRVDIAATGPTSSVPPGIPRLPGPGEFYASPAMSALLRAHSNAELADRYGGVEVATIGPSALPAPNSLIIVIGHDHTELAQVPDAASVTDIATVAPSGCDECPVGIGTSSDGIDLILFVVAAALLFPMLVFIGSATRLAAARREQRFAAMRLVGATPRQVSIISVVESSVAAGAGACIGFALFFALRPLVASVPLTGAPFFTHDLSLRFVDVLGVGIGVPVAAAAAARLALRRVHISPLGVSRRTAPNAPRARRLVPLLAGVAELTYFVVVGSPEDTPGQIKAYMPGILLILTGLMTAGPWLTMVGSRTMARRTDNPARLIAGRRLGDNPRAAFRAISGLVLALFVTTVAIAIMAAINANRGAPPSSSAANRTVIADVTQAAESPQQPPIADLRVRLSSIPGVSGVTVVRVDTTKPESPRARRSGVASCAELALTPAIGRCPTGADTVTIIPYLGGNDDQSSTVWAASDLTVAEMSGLPVQSINVATLGSSATIESARTLLERAYPYVVVPNTVGEFWTRRTRLVASYQQLADVVIVVSLPIAGCSLAVGVAGGLTDRKRPFSLLRLSGVPIRMLDRVVALESAIPLVLGALVSIAAAFVAAGLFLRSQLDYALRPPSIEYVVIVVVGLVASLGVIASMLPLLRRTTGPETARND